MVNNNKIATANSILKDFVKKAIALKYIYIISVFAFVLAAFLLNKYSQNIYEVQAKLLLRNDEQGKDLEKVFRNTPDYSNKSSLEDEIDMLKSYSLVNATISALNLEIGFFSEKSGILKRTKNCTINSPIPLFLINPITSRSIFPFRYNWLQIRPTGLPARK